MNDGSLSSRLLPRVDRRVAPVIWDLTGASAHGGEFFCTLAAAGANWFYAPFDVTPKVEAMGRVMAEALGKELKLVLPVSASELQSRRSTPLELHLDVFGVERCEAVMLEQASPGDVKAGGPFHRLSRLREKGMVDWFIVSAPDHATAEWMVHHSPAHAVCLPFGLGDLTAKYRLLEDAKNYGTGIIARGVESAAWGESHSAEEDVAFVAGEAGVTSMLAPLDRAKSVIEAMGKGMSEGERGRWWERFRQSVAAPTEPVRNLPPEFG